MNKKFMPHLIIISCSSLFLLVSGIPFFLSQSWSFFSFNQHLAISRPSLDGHFVVGSSEKKIYYFSKDSPLPIWEIKTDGQTSAKISLDGRYIVAGSGVMARYAGVDDGKSLYFIDALNSKIIWTYSDEKAVIDIQISDDGQYVAAATQKSLYYFKTNITNPLWEYSLDLTGSPIEISLAMSANGSYIAMGIDEKLYLFNKTIDNPKTPIWINESLSNIQTSRSCLISDNGEKIISSYGEKIFYFKKDSPTPIWQRDNYSPVYGQSSLSSDGSILAAITSDENVISLINTSTNLKLLDISDNSKAFNFVSLSLDGKYLATGFDHEVSLYESSSKVPLWKKGVWGYPRGEISSDGEFFIVETTIGYDLHILFRDNPTIFYDYMIPMIIGLVILGITSILTIKRYFKVAKAKGNHKDTKKKSSKTNHGKRVKSNENYQKGIISSSESKDKKEIAKKNLKIGVYCTSCQTYHSIAREQFDHFICEKCKNNNFNIGYFCKNCNRIYPLSVNDFIDLQESERLTCFICNNMTELIKSEK